MRYMNADQHFKVVSISAMCMAHYLNDSARLGWAIRRAVEEHYDGTVAILASGSLSHRFAQNGLAPDYAFRIWSPFWSSLTRRSYACGRPVNGRLLRHAARVRGQGPWRGFMHDTAMLLGLWAGRHTTARPKSSRRISVPRARARSMPFSRSRRRTATLFPQPRPARPTLQPPWRQDSEQGMTCRMS